MALPFDADQFAVAPGGTVAAYVWDMLGDGSPTAGAQRFAPLRHRTAVALDKSRQRPDQSVLVGRLSRYLVCGPAFCSAVPAEELVWLLFEPGTTVCPVPPGVVLLMEEPA
jgi:hypothetical protein